MSALCPLLDTSVVIDFPAARVAKVADEVAVSAVTIGELHYGVAAAADPLTQMHRRRRVQATLDRFEGLPFDVADAEYYGTLAALVSQHVTLAGSAWWLVISWAGRRETGGPPWSQGVWEGPG